MKKTLYLLAAAAVLLLTRVEHTGTDISDLEPVALVSVTMEENTVRIATDTGAEGTGGNLSEAVGNLHATAPATVFLDTAQYLLLNEETIPLLPQLYDLLRPGTRVCILSGKAALEEAAVFLKAHPPETTLLHCRAGQNQLPILYYNEGRGRLEQGNHQP